jgi:hypothetical protein
MDKAQGAKWTRKYINDLPDAAFAVVEPGGKKDGEGKTVPRGLRRLPHHNSSVKSPTENSSVDLPHLRNALARAPQMKIAENLRKRAMSHLQAHARELLKTGNDRMEAESKSNKEIINTNDINELANSLSQYLGDDSEKL